MSLSTSPGATAASSAPSQCCTFWVDGLYFGVAVSEVQEVLRYQELTAVPSGPEAVHGLINLRGQIVTALDLRCRLGLPARPEGVLPMNVIVRSRGEVVSLLVDDIGDVIDTVILAVDPERQRISLGIKQCVPNPGSAPPRRDIH